MGQMPDLIGAQGTATAGVLGPAKHPGFEERAIEDQLPAALEQVEQANLTLGTIELVLLFHRHPRHSSTLGGQRITGAGQGLLLHEKLLPRSFPLLLRHGRGCLHRDVPLRRLLVFLFARCHLILLSFLKQNEPLSLCLLFPASSSFDSRGLHLVKRFFSYRPLSGRQVLYLW